MGEWERVETEWYSKAGDRVWVDHTHSAEVRAVRSLAHHWLRDWFAGAATKKAQVMFVVDSSGDLSADTVLQQISRIKDSVEEFSVEFGTQVSVALLRQNSVREKAKLGCVTCGFTDIVDLDMREFAGKLKVCDRVPESFLSIKGVDATSFSAEGALLDFPSFNGHPLDTWILLDAIFQEWPLNSSKDAAKVAIIFNSDNNSSITESSIEAAKNWSLKLRKKGVSLLFVKNEVTRGSIFDYITENVEIVKVSPASPWVPSTSRLKFDEEASTVLRESHSRKLRKDASSIFVYSEEHKTRIDEKNDLDVLPEAIEVHTDKALSSDDNFESKHLERKLYSRDLRQYSPKTKVVSETISFQSKPKMRGKSGIEEFKKSDSIPASSKSTLWQPKTKSRIHSFFHPRPEGEKFGRDLKASKDMYSVIGEDLFYPSRTEIKRNPYERKYEDDPLETGENEEVSLFSQIELAIKHAPPHVLVLFCLVTFGILILIVNDYE